MSVRNCSYPAAMPVVWSKSTTPLALKSRYPPPILKSALSSVLLLAPGWPTSATSPLDVVRLMLKLFAETTGSGVKRRRNVGVKFVSAAIVLLVGVRVSVPLGIDGA